MQRQLNDADQRENARREAADLESSMLTGQDKVAFDVREDARRRGYEEVRAQLLSALRRP